MPRGLGTVLLIVVLAAALATLVATESFRRYVDKVLKDSGSSWVSRKFLSSISTLVYRRRDYKFFSTVHVPEEDTLFLGIFAYWLPVPFWRRLRGDADEWQR
ncbi:hypothetical protein SpCBS45565_g01626 [Spizellomyces sp. 'palustris']|nr:hypothetical protein SpCBS45565_g01626 [Spizellomyces sp. 'palustris']